VRWQYELVLEAGWPAATAVDVAFVYVLVRALFGRHPATPFALVAAVAANAIGWSFVAVRDPVMQIRPEAIGLVFVALAIAGMLRHSGVQSVWPYLTIPGGIVWYALYLLGVSPALALVPIVPFMAHSPRQSALFAESTVSKHWSPTHLEHELKYPVHAVLFLFGLVNAGVLLSGYGTGTWALLTASLVGKPVGLLAGAGLAGAVGLHRPRSLHWRDLIVVALATCGGFATGLYFATSVYPVGPLLGELKLGVIASGIGVLLTLGAAASLRDRTA
jgi:NhaA family Na+:H+ antiporter